ncbi:MAG: CDP-archaeol synthase [Candidatus Micrarchaeota archaeon]|nr:CDP-archaeol synthase [Candidatus Micrarchaeota archaeon]
MDFALAFLMLVFPAYAANAIPVLLGGGMTFDDLLKLKLFGKNKTIRGFLSGIIFGSLASLALMLFLPVQIRFSYVLFGIFSSLGAMLGDLLGSLLKRKIGIAEGKQFFLDQILFIAVALCFGYLFIPEIYNITVVIAVLIVTFFMHIIFNIIANKIGVKNVPW